MSNSLVTVIIPAYNCDKYIAYAIESVISQTYNNLELIVVDDGSIDNTAGVVMKYGEKLRYIRQENGGVSKARNTGIKNATGDYVAFLDSDDVWEKYKLEIQMDILKKHGNIGLIFSDFLQTKNKIVLNDRKYEDAFNIFKEYSYGISKIFKNIGRYNYSGNDVIYYWGDIYDYLFLGNFILPSSVLFKKILLDKVGFLNEQYKIAEETEFFLRFSRHCEFGFIQFPLVRYEIPRTDNLSGKKNTENLIKNALIIQIDSLIKISNLIDKNKFNFFKHGISKTYSRLAYYYLSEYNLFDARKYTVYAIKTSKLNLMSYYIYICSFIPNNVLEIMAKLKTNLMKNGKTFVSMI